MTVKSSKPDPVLIAISESASQDFGCQAEFLENGELLIRRKVAVPGGSTQ